ncbi:hypothetical protein GY45DRAFT_371256 [Cubamyces sp. BRFM 1775]|nr:hypothetical protein GY45DRAFT_371256 [Cubamyces sp. BRFM 1775]
MHSPPYRTAHPKNFNVRIGEKRPSSAHRLRPPFTVRAGLAATNSATGPFQTSCPRYLILDVVPASLVLVLAVSDCTLRSSHHTQPHRRRPGNRALGRGKNLPRAAITATASRGVQPASRTSCVDPGILGTLALDLIGGRNACMMSGR